MQGDYLVEKEVDLVEQIQRLWLCRRLIVSVALLCLIVGCVVACLLPKQYRAWCEVVPQTTSSSRISNLSSLAALAGINLARVEEESVLSPYIYENIFASVAFRKRLLQTKVYSLRDGGRVTLFDYFLSGAEVREENTQLPSDYPTNIDVVSHADYICLRELEKRVTLTLDDRRGYLQLSALMPEPLLAAEVAQAALELLQRDIMRLKTEKVQSNLEFVRERYNQARHDFEQIQMQRATFRDANRNTTRHTAQTALERLDAEYSLAMNIYSELAMQLEQAKIKAKEEIPLLTVISPVTIPFRKDKPRRMIIICIFALVGVVLGSFLALALPTIARITGYSSLLRLLPREVLRPMQEDDAQMWANRDFV